MKQTIGILLLLLPVLLFPAAPVFGGTQSGTVRIGYIYTDLTGNQGTYQPTYNLYEGSAFSLENFRYQWDNGLRVTANMVNPFLKNRRFNVGLSKAGHGGLNVSHNSYRRSYDFDGDNTTQRRTSYASAWVRPSRQVKLFGGFGYADKRGRAVDLTESALGAGVNHIDYTIQDFHAGAEFKHRRSFGRVEYRIGDFNDYRSQTNDHKSKRIRMTFYSPIPKHKDFVVSGGYQHFTRELENRLDTLKANTVWGATQYAHHKGYKIRYSFMFDRTRRRGDPLSTDNIIHAVHVGKAWRNRGEITVGYGQRVKDDERIQRSADEYSLTGRFQVTEQLKLQAGIDRESHVVDSGRTLTGAYDRARNWLSAKYRVEGGYLRLKLEDRQKDNDDIGSKVDFKRMSFDGILTDELYGELMGSFAYGKGEYENSAGLYEYKEYTLSGEASTRKKLRFQAGLRGTYYRAQQDVDIESFALELIGRYRILERTQLELTYSAHNFDDLNDPAEVYGQYYTANVVQVVIAYEL